MTFQCSEEIVKEQVDSDNLEIRRISSSAYTVHHKREIQSNIRLCIVPIYVSCTDNPEKEIKAYVMIDIDCTSCFVINEVMETIAQVRYERLT